MNNQKNITDISSASSAACKRSLLMRVHFWAALIASPFALIAIITGLIYLFAPQIDAALYDKLDHVAPVGHVQSLDDMVGAAKLVAPSGWVVHSVVPAFSEGNTTRINFVASSGNAPSEHNHGAMTVVKRPTFGLPSNTLVVYVNPYTAQVVGSLDHAKRFNNWSKKLHSRLLQTDGWRWMIELAASCLLVMLLTGIMLWLPRMREAFVPRLGVNAPIWWRQWHIFIGVSLSIITLVMLTTGLTWSKYAGDQIRNVRDYIGQAPPKVPQDIKSQLTVGAKKLDWQGALDNARILSPKITLQLTPPLGVDGVWRVSTPDRSQPTQNFDLLFDAYSGKKLYYAGWDKQTTFSQATAIGIPFHRGEFGWWNQLLLLCFALGLLFSLCSGWMMFYQRYQRGQTLLPKLLPGALRRMSFGMFATMIILCMVMPVLACVVLVVLALELFLQCPWGKIWRKLLSRF